MIIDDAGGTDERRSRRGALLVGPAEDMILLVFAVVDDAGARGPTLTHVEISRLVTTLACRLDKLCGFCTDQANMRNPFDHLATVRTSHSIFDAAALEWLAAHARQVFAKMDCRLWASDGEADHLHILVEYPPKLSVSVLLNAFKGTSSRMLCRNRQTSPPAIATVVSLRWRSRSMSSNRGSALPPRPKA